METFNVWIFFQDGSYIPELRRVSSEQAMDRFRSKTMCPAAKMGLIKRVIITDGGDSTNAEWFYEFGYVFPPELVNLAILHNEKATRFTEAELQKLER